MVPHVIAIVTLLLAMYENYIFGNFFLSIVCFVSVKKSLLERKKWYLQLKFAFWASGILLVKIMLNKQKANSWRT